MSSAFPQRVDAWTTSAAVAAVLAFGAAFAVRGIEGRTPVPAADRPRAPEELAAPMQLIGPSGRLRAGELAPRLREPLRKEWVELERHVTRLDTCPPTSDWLATPLGQRVERLLDELRRGSREEALAALHLVFELARRTQWAPGLRARTQHADKLASLHQDWLRTWGERAAEDALLSEPAVAATLAYGALMRRVSQPHALSSNAEALERAKRFLSSLLQSAHGQPTRLAGVLRTRHPKAIDAFQGKRDVLAGFASAFEQAFPDLDGECGR